MKTTYANRRSYHIAGLNERIFMNWRGRWHERARNLSDWLIEYEMHGVALFPENAALDIVTIVKVGVHCVVLLPCSEIQK